MAITNFTELKTAIENWLNETGNVAIQTNAEDFILLAETALRDNKLFRPRYLQTRTTLTTTAGTDTVALPTGFLEAEQIRLESTPPRVLEATVQSNMDQTTVPGVPDRYVIEGNNLRLSRPPAIDYDISLLHHQFPEGLSMSNPTNLILQNQPNVYLWASILQAAVYNKDDEAVDKYAALLGNTIQARYDADNEARYAAPMRLTNQYLDGYYESSI